MRSRYRPPLNKQYFHTKPRIDKRDMVILKRKIEIIKKKNNKKELEEHIR
jgi:hypothetical protein